MYGCGCGFDGIDENSDNLCLLMYYMVMQYYFSILYDDDVLFYSTLP